MLWGCTSVGSGNLGVIEGVVVCASGLARGAAGPTEPSPLVRLDLNGRPHEFPPRVVLHWRICCGAGHRAVGPREAQHGARRGAQWATSRNPPRAVVHHSLCSRAGPGGRGTQGAQPVVASGPQWATPRVPPTGRNAQLMRIVALGLWLM